MMQVACNRPIMLPLAVSIGSRRIKPRVVLSGERKSVPVSALCVLLYVCCKNQSTVHCSNCSVNERAGGTLLYNDTSITQS